MRPEASSLLAMSVTLGGSEPSASLSCAWIIGPVRASSSRSTSCPGAGRVGLAALATAASARAAHGGTSPAAARAAGYDLVFLIAGGIGLAIAVVSVLLPQTRAAARPEPARLTATLGTAARESGARPAGGAGR